MLNATKIYEFFSCNVKGRFIVPLYQRAYAWDMDNCKRLFDDLMKVHRDHVPTHFFGAIVTVKENDYDDDRLIIDGQQRVTTVSIILLALLNAVRNGDLKGDAQQIEDMVWNFLYACFKSNKKKPLRLVPIEQDRNAYEALFTNDREQFVSGSGFTRNYDYFYDRVKQSRLTGEELYDAVQRLIIIDLRLSSSDNPQLIFESLNSTGKDLTEADKIRNYLLMSLTKERQENYYHKYWIKIEERAGGEPTWFFRDYLTIRLRRICRIDKLYFEFKDYDEGNGTSRVTFLEDLLKYAGYYAMINNCATESVDVNRKLRQLANIGSAVSMPFFMMFFNYAQVNSLTEKEVYEVLDIIEGYWARRIICAYPTNVLANLFATLHNDIMRLEKDYEDHGKPKDACRYSDMLRYILLNKQGAAVYPNDDEVANRFPSRQIYRLPANYRCFLFERMENGDSKEGDKQVAEALKNGDYSIEHIMPQTLNTAWKHALGEHWQDIHEKYLHTFANLTLSASEYNIIYSNQPFAEKKKNHYDSEGKIVYGYDESKFSLSDYLKRCSQWTEKEMEKRGELLLGKFLSLWPMITTKCEPLERNVETVAFDDDDYPLAGRSILSFVYKGKKHDVKTWKDMVEQLSRIIYNEDPAAFTYLCHKNHNLHDTDRKWGKYLSKIAEDCYVWTAGSIKTKRGVIQYLLAERSIPKSDLILNLKPINTD